ncbi:MAG: phosphoribosylanthranilate isomerase [Euryarchaeota archaeon]|nr:phosphoribosylanthranilate isomerase [Euryarchaeota archaeon]
MNVKICGIRRIEDMKACEKYGADLIGFINIKRSKRFVEIEEINDLTFSMKNKEKAVLVIEPENLKEAEERIKKSTIKTIQLHSLAAPEINKIKKIDNLIDSIDDLKIIKAIGIPEKINALKREEIKNFSAACDCLLFDYELEGKTGGTGMQIPIKAAVEAAKIAKNANNDIKLFLAGGMNVEKIKKEGRIIKQVFDFIDANSGVEDCPGIKNAGKIDEVMKIAKELD